VSIRPSKRAIKSTGGLRVVIIIGASTVCYCLPSPEVIDKLKSNNYGCEAFYLPNDDGTIDSVYLYQDGKFIAECRKVVKYQEAVAERTEADEAAMVEQHKYNARYYKMVREGKEQKIVPVGIVKTSLAKEIRQIKNVETAPPLRDEIDAIVEAVYSNDFYPDAETKELAKNSM
jgi:hypothetical protein